MKSDFLKVIEVFEFKEMNISDTNSLISILANYGYLVEVKEKIGPSPEYHKSHNVVIYQKLDNDDCYYDKHGVKATVWKNP